MATSTTYSLKGFIDTTTTVDPTTGANTTKSTAYIPVLEFTDNSLTPKVNDWLVDANSNTWVITGIDKDPLEATYWLPVRKL